MNKKSGLHTDLIFLSEVFVGNILTVPFTLCSIVVRFRPAVPNLSFRGTTKDRGNPVAAIGDMRLPRFALNDGDFPMLNGQDAQYGNSSLFLDLSSAKIYTVSIGGDYYGKRKRYLTASGHIRA